MSLLMVEEEEHNKQQMEAEEGATTTPCNINNVNILKGKRTKRQRPQSPLPFTVAPANSSSNNAGGDYVNSTTTSDEDSAGPVTTEEEEDMAKCLLLLSQGGPRNDHTHFGTVPYKFTSKKYLETSTTSNGKTGIYVYQCKTCNRTFPSFQALGGHRASHRKPKNVNAVLENKPRLIISDEDEDHNQQPTPPFKRSFSASSLSLQLTTRTNIPFNNTEYNKYSPKVHECAICGTEFSSGQALGGHMRRHRGGAPVNRSNATTNANTKTLPLLPFCPNPISAIDPIDYHQQTKKLKTSSVNLSLDLNLPAATEDENKQHKQNLESPAYSFSSPPQQQQQQQQKQTSLVLSAAPTLVDCQH
ncbi:Cupredoxin superfamily protein [Heracleum sosnowskyi]|uniref:Cupredoxin superfamily protein n=1 Tax=Heracleum sosnowskyi TaxID=360622 RepID=A0AAD8J3C4_9APIA|nr:Cupredoxin superfamily protein [Heracleum sosnowskyi]